jgi:hypothetical protein
VPDFSHPHLAVDGASLADRTVIANRFSDDLGKAIAEIVVVQQFAGASSGARGRRGLKFDRPKLPDSGALSRGREPK